MTLHTIWRTIVAVGVVLSLPAGLQAQRASERFTKQEMMIPMRDGIRLNTEIYVPKQATGPLPVVLTRTPYGLGHDQDGFSPALATSYRELAEDGYIFVFQDIRGRFKSEGQFVMLRPPRDPSDRRAIDEGTDTWDTIDWVLKNIPGHNGRAGMLGISYGGWLTVMAMLDPHPALKAVSPQASPADMWLGDDFHHNGAFRLSYGFEYATMMETTKEITPFPFDERDVFEWFLKVGTLANINPRYLQGKIPTWNDYASHPDYDAFWQRQGVARYLTRVTLPTLNVAGWWDQEDFYGPLKIYELLERHDSKGVNRIVVGPWNHGGWARGDGEALGRIKFDQPTSRYYRQEIQRPWFAHHLRGAPDPNLPEAMVFETGANKWVPYETWPPVRVSTTRQLYFHPQGKLSFEKPSDTSPTAHDDYVSDPNRPVPYRARPILPLTERGSTWPIWLVDDQRHAHLRPDVLSWESEPLTEDLVISGHVLANLFISTSGTDGDWVVKLIDAYPEKYEPDPTLGGYQLMVANEVMRARYRESWEKPVPLVPDQVTPLAVDLRHANHRFRKGHRIMVQVQSTWFPLIDRNPQTFVPNIFQAKGSDFIPATQRVFRSAAHASHIQLPVVSGGLTP
jgi:putative CocE/NonD family hydrolase